MAKKYGEAGTGARWMADKRKLAILGFAVVFLLGSLLLSKNIGSFAKIGLPGIVVLFVGFKIFESYTNKKTDELDRRAGDAERGARGEEKVAEALANLTDGFEVYNDVQFEGFNIDHVVASPAGVFLVETKSHRGKVSNEGDKLLLNGKIPEKDFLNQTWSQTYRLQDYLKEKMNVEVKVQPILCFSSAFVRVRTPLKGIEVMNVGLLGKYFDKQERQIISPQELSRIRVALKRKL